MAISHLEPWRAEIPIKFFASRIRFQIRIDDLRASVKIGKAKIDDILGKFFFFPQIRKYFSARVWQENEFSNACVYCTLNNLKK